MVQERQCGRIKQCGLRGVRKRSREDDWVTAAVEELLRRKYHSRCDRKSRACKSLGERASVKRPMRVELAGL